MNKESFSYLGAVEIFLLSPDEKEVLLLHRAQHRKVLPGYYAGIGGKMDKDLESPMETALRELKEETNYFPDEINNLILKAVITANDRFGKWIVFEFTGKVKYKKFEVYETKEGKFEWIDVKNLKELKLIPDLQGGILERILFDDNFLWIKSIFDKYDRMIDRIILSKDKSFN